MTESAVVYTQVRDSAAAGRDLCGKLSAALPGQADALILFASPHYDHPTLLATLDAGYGPKVLVGASSAGEFTSDQRGDGMACALALRSTSMQFRAAIGRGLHQDRAGAALQVATAFRGVSDSASSVREGFVHRSALVMTDALAGHADELVDELTLATNGRYQFFGGGAGDDAQFRRTHVFFGREALTDAAVALEILSDRPVGIGVGHGWEPTGPGMRVTAVDGMKVVSLNGLPAIEAFEVHAEETGQTLDRAVPIPFFLHNVLGIATGSGYRLRVPLSVGSDGAVLCAAEVPVGATVHIMQTTAESAIEAAERATRAAAKGLDGHKPHVALFFDCVATRLRIGDAFGLELQSLAGQLGGAAYIGCNTHGQIARAEGQFGGFHNCTAVVCLLPE